MSRIGKKPITLPDKVKIHVSGEGAINVEGPKGKLSWTLPPAIKARVEGSSVIFDRQDETRQVRALHGLSRALVSNMVTGVSTGALLAPIAFLGPDYDARLRDLFTTVDEDSLLRKRWFSAALTEDAVLTPRRFLRKSRLSSIRTWLLTSDAYMQTDGSC